MAKTMDQASFSSELLGLLEETFGNHRGFYLDKGTSLLETLDRISADEASIPVGGRCATIAAQVEHVLFYLEVLERDITGQAVGELDWDAIWRHVSRVSPAEWEALKANLRAAYDRLSKMLRSVDDWEQNDVIGASMAIVVHTAYHLGEIRQALCTVGQVRPMS